MAGDRRGARFRRQQASSAELTQPPGTGQDSPTLDRLEVGYSLAQLCAEDRAVICRAYYQGWTTAQIAADLGITEGMVKSRLHYALRAFRQTLAKRVVTEARQPPAGPPF